MFKRSLCSTVAVMAAMLFFASDLLAHGGQFRGPFGRVPPGIREPFDPATPPPVPESGPVTPPVGPDSPDTTPDPSMPDQPDVTGPGGTPSPTVKPPTGNRPRAAARGFEAWEFWWEHNKERYLQLKNALYTPTSSESSIWDVGGRSESGRNDAMHDIEALVKSTIIPALAWAMDPENSGHQDTESAAYIALAKMATQPKHIEDVMRGLDKKLKRDLITQEASALALGLFRRTDEDRQFDAVELDKIRKFAFQIFQDDFYGHRTRAFAALSLGLLGDQPTGSQAYMDTFSTATQEEASAAAARRATTARLFELLQNDYPAQDLPISLLMAIGLQAPDSFAPEQLAVLRQCATKGRLFRKEVNNLIRSYAVLQLGRVGTDKDIGVLQRVITMRGADRNVQRSAAIGLGTLASLVDSGKRAEVARGLLKAIDRRKIKDPSAVNFAYISLAYLVIEDVKSNQVTVVEENKVLEFFLEEADKGRYLQRPYAALALGLVGREIGEQANLDVYATFHNDAREALRAGVRSKKLDKSGRAAFALSMGLIKDHRNISTLLELVRDSKEDAGLRGYAAVGVGLTGNAPKRAKEVIRAALRERRTEAMRVQCATALGLMQDERALPMLREELKIAKSQSIKGQVVLAMARIGTHKAVQPLVDLLKNKSGREQDLTRALACAGLGVIGDLEWLPSLSRASANTNYRASVDVMNEYYSII